MFELQKYLDILYQGVWNNIPSMQADSDMGCWFAKNIFDISTGTTSNCIIY